MFDTPIHFYELSLRHSFVSVNLAEGSSHWTSFFGLWITLFILMTSPGLLPFSLIQLMYLYYQTISCEFTRPYNSCTETAIIWNALNVYPKRFYHPFQNTLFPTTRVSQSISSFPTPAPWVVSSVVHFQRFLQSPNKIDKPFLNFCHPFQLSSFTGPIHLSSHQSLPFTPLHLLWPVIHHAVFSSHVCVFDLYWEEKRIL